MLASTMQHSTHHHTPNPPHHHHTHTPQHGSRCVRRSRPGAATTSKPHQTHSRCPLRTQQHAQLVRLHHGSLALCSTQPHPPPTSRMWNQKKGKPRNTRHEARPPITGRLLRKEVIQPHLPVRLPCYDFVPIAGPTFDHSPPQRGLGHGLRVLPTFVT